MNGRVLANATVFALGLILVVGGAWGIWRGSDYIQIERGWTSVISGSVAVTGGVLTLAVGFVLRRLDALSSAVLSAGTPVLTPREAVPAVAEPMPLGLEPAPAIAVPEPPAMTHEPQAATPRLDTGPVDPAFQAATAINLALLDHEERSPGTEKTEAPAVPSQPASQPVEAVSAEPSPELLHAADQGPADDMVKAAGASDEPELDAAIEELLAEERARDGVPQQLPEISADTLPVGSQSPSEAHPAAPALQRESAVEEAPQRERGWRGLFSRKQRNTEAAAGSQETQIEPPRPEADSISPELEYQDVPEPPAKQAPVPGEAIPGTGDDWFDRALSGLDEAPYQRPGKVAEDDVSHVAGDEGDLTRSEIETYRPTLKEPLPAAPAPAEPAVIGRYTSGTTTYIMFADGSIEAETPTGILRFASLAELKVYVEGGQ